MSCPETEDVFEILEAEALLQERIELAQDIARDVVEGLNNPEGQKALQATVGPLLWFMATGGKDVNIELEYGPDGQLQVKEVSLRPCPTKTE